MIATVYLWVGSRVERIEGASSGPYAGKTERWTLLVVAEGSGTMTAEGKNAALSKGKCAIVKPGVPLRIRNGSAGGALALHWIEFCPLATGQAKEEASIDAELPEEAVHPKPASAIGSLAQRLYDRRHREDALGKYGNHVLFQQILHEVLQAGKEGREQAAARAVERTIRAMDDDSSLLSLSLAELAEQAGLSARHYSRVFQELAGKSPIEYQTGVRMRLAKRLLSTTDESITRIADRVGYRDPFHFSRAFKQYAGLSPKVYGCFRKRHMRVASLQFLGEMLALGVKPVGAPDQLLDCEFYDGYTEGIEPIAKTVVTPDIERLAALRPDAIVTFDGHHYEAYARIAPTLDIPWTMPFFDRFRLIADLVGKSDDAEEWLTRYEAKLSETKARLLSTLERGETASFFWMRGLPDTFQAYYESGVLYRDLGWPAPTRLIEDQLRQKQPFKRDIPLGELAAYTGDYMFVVVSADPESQARFAELSRSERWLQLPAVRNGRVYVLTEDWLRVDPLSLAGQLARLERMMRHGGERISRQGS